jgi:hypothetical protein
MSSIDRTTKLLLVVIAVLLGVIAFRVAPDAASTAHAQSGASPRTPPVPVPARLQTEMVNRINFQNQITGMEVMPTDNMFLVRTANSVEVYRVALVPIR